MFVYTCGFSMISPVLPSIITHLGAEPRVIGTIYSTFAIAAALSSLVVGRAADAWGPRPVILLCLFGVAAGNAAAYTATNITAFIACRCLTGLFSATMTVVLALVGLISTSPKQRSERVAMLTATMSASFLFAPSLGGALHAFSPMAPLLAAAVAAALAGTLAAITLPRTHGLRAVAAAEHTSPRPVAMASYDGPADMGASYDAIEDFQAEAAGAPAVAAAAEDRTAALAAARRDPAIRVLLLAAFLAQITANGFAFFTLTAMRTLHWTPSGEVAGLYTAAGGLAIVVNGFAFKALTARVGIMRTGVVASLVRGAGWLAAPSAILAVHRGTVPAAPGAALVGSAMLLVTAGHSLATSFSNVALMERLDGEGGAAVRGQVLGWMSFAVTLGSVAGPALLAALSERSPVAGAAPFWFCGAVCCACAALYYGLEVALLRRAGGAVPKGGPAGGLAPA